MKPDLNDDTDPFAETRAKVRAFMKERGIPDEHVEVFEPYAMRGVAFLADNPPHLVLKHYPRVTAVAGLSLIALGSYALTRAILQLRQNKTEKTEEPTIKAV